MRCHVRSSRTNARLAAPDGGRLVVETQTLVPDGAAMPASSAPGTRHICVTVSDADEVIPADALEKIFEPAALREDREDLGLALPVARGIVRNHGGSLSVESAEGRGTAFRILLPLAR